MQIVTLLSGGMDSVTLLYHWAKQGDTVRAISFDYGSKHNKRELAFAQYHCAELNVPLVEVHLPFIQDLFQSHLLEDGGEIPDGHYTDPIMKKTVVPFRNGIMLSIACGYAESLGYEAVSIASHAGDHTVYPDCRPGFNASMRGAMHTGTYSQVKLLAPFAKKEKWEIAALGLGMGIDYDLTWSCYKGGETHCGTCGTCVERIEALNKGRLVYEQRQEI